MSEEDEAREVTGRGRRGGGCLALALGLVAALGVLEGGARVLLPAPPADLHMPDPSSLFRLTPGYRGSLYFGKGQAEAAETPIRVNRWGCRGDDIAETKAPGELRVLCLGDSYTFGLGSLEASTFPAQLEAALGDHFRNAPVRVINAGTGGQAPWQERIRLNDTGWRLQPDVVVLQTFMSNDIGETLLRDGKKLRAAPRDWLHFVSQYRYANTMPFQINHVLRVHSHAFWMAEKALLGHWCIVSACRAVGWPSLQGAPMVSAGRNWLFETDMLRWYPEMEQGWQALQRDVQGIKEDCAAHGVPLVAFNMPNPMRPEVYAHAAKILDRASYEPHRGDRMMEEFLSAQTEHMVPMLERFLSDPEWLTFPEDGHLNPAGNKKVAAWLAEVIIPLLDGKAVNPDA